jgi:hypothetical protein
MDHPLGKVSPTGDHWSYMVTTEARLTRVEGCSGGDGHNAVVGDGVGGVPAHETKVRNRWRHQKEDQTGRCCGSPRGSDTTAAR